MDIGLKLVEKYIMTHFKYCVYICVPQEFTDFLQRHAVFNIRSCCGVTKYDNAETE